MTPGRRWATPLDVPVVIVVHGLLSSARRSSDDSDWPVHFRVLSFRDLRGLPLLHVVFFRRRIMATDMAEP